MTTKKHILSEIRRLTLESDDGRPPGARKFADRTGITTSEWRGKLWAKWNDAIEEAGFTPNEPRSALPDEQLLSLLADLTRELGHFPTQPELKLKAYNTGGFPAESTFRRLGGMRELAVKTRAWLLAKGDVTTAAQCPEPRGDARKPSNRKEPPDSALEGWVYLMRHGSRREYKIGRTRDTLRRHGEIRVEFPREIRAVHTIRTDDPVGVEHYWHRRFEDKRLKGEWFELSDADVRAFKRWRKIY